MFFFLYYCCCAIINMVNKDLQIFDVDVRDVVTVCIVIKHHAWKCFVDVSVTKSPCGSKVRTSRSHFVTAFH